VAFFIGTEGGKSPTSRKKREKWGTRHPAIGYTGGLFIGQQEQRENIVVKIPCRACDAVCGHGVLRLRETIRFANLLASLRMTGRMALRTIGVGVMLHLILCANASATTYYVSSSTGSDANNGTSSTTAWQTIAHVNGQTFNPGDSVLFKRGDVWNESLTPPSSGSSGSPITFDAYGTGAAPNLTGYYAVPTTAWVLVTGNAWKAPVPSTYTAINFCLFGSIWGQKVSAVSSNLTAQWDFYLANGYVYVFSVGNPATYYNEAIVPMALSNVPVINVNGKSWLTFQHFLVNWFDQYGVYVQGTSDHLVFANMEADSMIPQGTQPLGFYVDESAPGPGDIKIYNAEAHLNYDGFRFDGTATAITMVNDKGYANRDGALVDNTGAVTYSYCHFYASSLAVAGSTDVEWTSGTGPIAGAGNIAVDTPAAVQVWQRYPAEVTLTVDDAGMTPGADTYYAGTVLPVADAAGVPVGAAITVGYPLAQTLVSEFQGWINAGRDVTSHSISHTYYVNPDALDIQYIGSGTAATLNISSNTLSITVTGASDSVSYNLAQGQPQGTMLGLAEALAATGKYTYSFLTPCQGPYGTGCSAYTAAALLSQDLANVSGQDVKSAVYHMQLNITQLTTDEINLSRQWMTTNLTGLPATPVYVYPGGYETTAMQGITEGVPYTGARGALKEDLGVLDTYADGFNVQNITSFGVNPSWMGASGVTPTILNQKIQALVWKQSVWGVPWGIFWHLNELTQDDPVGGTEITNLIQDFKNDGATVQTNTGLVNWLHGGTQETGTDGNYYYKRPATSMTLDFRPTKNSPVVDAGENLGTAYALDINGVNQNSYGSGWEIGAHVYQGYAAYGEGAGSGYFAISYVSPLLNMDAYSQPGNICSYGASDGPATLPESCYYTNPAAAPSLGVVHNIMTATDLTNCTSGSSACPGGAMVCGDIGSLAAGVTFSGNFTDALPACDANHYITWQSSAAASLPAYGTTITPCAAGIASLPGRPTFNCTSTANILPEIQTPNGSSAFSFANGVSYRRLSGLRIDRLQGDGLYVGSPIGTGGNNLSYIIFDHVMCNGSEMAGEPTQSCMIWNTDSYMAAVDSFLYDFWCQPATGCTDSQAISGGSSTTNDNTWKIVNNYLEASGENILFGGGAASTTPSDIEIYYNHLYKPWTQWCPAATCAGGTTGSQQYVVKDLFEMKNVARMLVENNIMEYMWQSVGATSVPMGAKNQGANLAPNATVHDVTFRYNIVRHGVQCLGAYSVNSDPGGAVPMGTYDLSYHDIVCDDINGATWGGQPGGDFAGIFTCGGTNTCGAPPVHNVTINHVTSLTSNASNATGHALLNNIYDSNNVSPAAVPLGTLTCTGSSPYTVTASPDVGYSFGFSVGNYVQVLDTNNSALNAAQVALTAASSSSIAWQGSGACPTASTTGGTASLVYTVSTTCSGNVVTATATGPTVFPGTWTGGKLVRLNNSSPGGYDGTFSLISASSSTLTWAWNTLSGSCSGVAAGSGGTVGLQEQQNNIVVTNNVAGNGQYGILGGVNSLSYVAALNAFLSNYTLTGNVVVAGSSGSYPGGQNGFPAAYANVGFVNYNGGNGGDYRLCTGAGTPTSACLAASAYHNACDGGTTDCGANISQVLAGTAGVVFAAANSLPSTFFGFTENNTAASNFPTVNYGMQRFWDSPPLQWPSINTASGVFDFTNLDANLAQAYSNGITAILYTLARTPPWASSNPTDTTCAYTTASSGGGDGECDAPYDLNADGSGTNATWKAWITAIAGHVNATGYCTGAGATHACIKYWEIWNEPDTWADADNRFWAGTFAQLARLTEDANCIITGRGVIHQSGNGTATACTATAIDPTAKIVMASGHAKTVALTFAQNQLYCNNTTGIPGGELPCPNPANATAAAVDIINFHMKPGNETGNNCPAPTPCTPESAMRWYISNIQGILQSAELAKPLWDGEAAYSDEGFTGAYSDPDMASSFMPRYYLIDWSLGISGMAWYTWDELEAMPAEVETSYEQTYAWLTGEVLTSPCAAAGTVWSCGITKPGTPYLVMWDTAQSCSGGSCTTGNQTVGSQWTQYQDMTTASTPIAISGHIVPVGIKPVVLH
jgi:hypothetical protein